jgi:hypothetical protein
LSQDDEIEERKPRKAPKKKKERPSTSASTSSTAYLPEEAANVSAEWQQKQHE